MQHKTSALEAEIAELKAAEEVLRADAERLRFMAESMPQKIFTARPNGEVDYFNPQWTEFTGLSFEEIRDWGWTQFIHPDDVEENVRCWQHCIDTGEPFELEHRFRRADGVYRWHLSRACAMRDSTGTVLAWTGSNTDIDEQKRAEEEAARRARLAALSADVGVALTQGHTLQEMLQCCAEAVVSHLDAAFARIWTLEAPSMLELQASAGIYTHLDGAHSRVPVGEFKIGRIAQMRQPHLTNQVVGDSEVHEQEWAKREELVSFAGYPLLMDKRVVGVLAMFARHPLSDDTLTALASIADTIALGIERQRVEEARVLARAEAEAQRAHLHELFMQAPAIIGIVRGPDHVYEMANPRYMELIGHRDIVGKPLREAIPELVGQGMYEILDTVYATGEPFFGNELPMSLDRGRGVPEEGYFNFVYQPFRVGNGPVQGILVHAVEVTDQVRARRELERLAAEREATLGQIADGVLIVDATGRTIFLNEMATRLLGVDVIGVPAECRSEVYGLLTPEGAPFIPEDLPTMRAIRERRDIIGVDMLVRRRDGTEIAVQENAAPIVAEDGSLVGAVATFRDMSAERELERQKDDFLSAAAHDLKNPVAVLQGQTQLLQRRVRRGSFDQEKVLEGLALIESRARGMTRLINDLLDVTRLRMGQKLDLNQQREDLAELVRQSVAAERHAAGGHRLVLEGADSELIGFWDSARLSRVLGNLLTNAVKYSPGGPEITITLSREESLGGSQAVLTVRDQGLGIPAHDLPHIFEWLYRAENVAGTISGTGIGLAGARQIVEQHGGTISVESQEGIGSTFTVRLPLDLAASSAPYQTEIPPSTDSR